MFDYNNSYQMIESRNQELRREADHQRLVNNVVRANRAVKSSQHHPTLRQRFLRLAGRMTASNQGATAAERDLEIADMPC
jgi:hypothetical protein